METRKHCIEEIMASINAFKHKMQFKIAQQGKHDHITHSQWYALCIIGQHKNLGIKEIAKMLGVTPSAATQLVDGLVENGYAARKTSDKDKRFLQIGLSPKGQKSITVIKRQYIKAMEILFKALSDDELTTYLALHKKILTHANHE